MKSRNLYHVFFSIENVNIYVCIRMSRARIYRECTRDDDAPRRTRVSEFSWPFQTFRSTKHLSRVGKGAWRKHSSIKKKKKKKDIKNIARANCRSVVFLFLFSVRPAAKIIEAMHARITLGIMQITVFAVALFLGREAGRGVILITAGASRGVAAAVVVVARTGSITLQNAHISLAAPAKNPTVH